MVRPTAGDPARRYSPGALPPDPKHRVMHAQSGATPPDPSSGRQRPDPDMPAPTTPEWYRQPDGTWRFWNGVRWSERRQQTDRPELTVRRDTAPAGWYPAGAGRLAWWDGQRWGDMHGRPVIIKDPAQYGGWRGRLQLMYESYHPTDSLSGWYPCPLDPAFERLWIEPRSRSVVAPGPTPADPPQNSVPGHWSDEVRPYDPQRHLRDRDAPPAESFRRFWHDTEKEERWKIPFAVLTAATFTAVIALPYALLLLGAPLPYVAVTLPLSLLALMLLVIVGRLRDAGLTPQDHRALPTIDPQGGPLRVPNLCAVVSDGGTRFWRLHNALLLIKLRR
jgi:hypothetical protein